MIPDHVAAYAAGWHAAARVGGRRLSWLEVAALVARAGLGSFPTAELQAAAWAWAEQHVAGEVMRDLYLPNRSKKGTPRSGRAKPRNK